MLSAWPVSLLLVVYLASTVDTAHIKFQMDKRGYGAVAGNDVTMHSIHHPARVRATVLSQPSDVRAMALRPHSIIVAWSPPPLYNLQEPLLGYKVLYQDVSSNKGEGDVKSQTTKQLEIVLEGLDKLTNYSVQVLGYTKARDGEKSTPIYVYTGGDGNVTPPEGLDQSEAGNKSMVFVVVPICIAVIVFVVIIVAMFLYTRKRRMRRRMRMDVLRFTEVAASSGQDKDVETSSVNDQDKEFSTEWCQ